MQFNFFKYVCSKSVLFSENQWKYQKVTKSKIKWSQVFYREVGSVMLRKHESRLVKTQEKGCRSDP